MQTMPKFDGYERSVLYVVKVYKAFEGHETGKVILMSSANSETSPSCRFVNQEYMIAIVGLKSKSVT